MYPIALDLKAVPVLLVGKGDAFIKREEKLRAAGAGQLKTSHEFNEYDLEDAAVVMVAGLSYENSRHIAERVRAARKLVNVEDVNDLCDFYFSAQVTRGDLSISISTGGASPTLAKRVRDKVASLFGEEWAGRTQEMKDHRNALRADGKNMKEVAAASEAFLDQKGWL